MINKENNIGLTKIVHAFVPSIPTNIIISNVILFFKLSRLAQPICQGYT